MGNTVVWKPARQLRSRPTSSCAFCRKPACPPGVINLIYGPVAKIGDASLASPELAGIHFTGSTDVFNLMWQHVGDNIGELPQLSAARRRDRRQRLHPRPPVRRLDALATAIVRGCFEYQGQKCSAASRVYVASSLWPRAARRLADQVKTLKIGDVCDFSNFMGAVIDASH